MPRTPFVIRERVRWGDCDPMGIIRYDAYMRFFELGESEMFRSLGISYASFAERFGITLPRRVMHLEYPSPPRLDELLELHVYVSEVGGSSLRLNFDAYGDGERAADGGVSRPRLRTRWPRARRRDSCEALASGVPGGARPVSTPC